MVKINLRIAEQTVDVNHNTPKAIPLNKEVIHQFYWWVPATLCMYVGDKN
jgi:hypothetical protein